MSFEEGTGTATPIKAVPVRHPGRWVASAIIAVLAAMLVHSFFANKQYGWSIIGHNLFSHPILSGVLLTIELTVISMAIGIVGGILLAVMRLSGNPVLTGTAALYIWLFRGTPVIVQLVIWFNLSYLYPHIAIGVPFGVHFVNISANTLISKFTAAILGLGLNEAAYMAEIVRAGILSVDEGQGEAAAALGMPSGLVMRRVVLPQAMRVIVPPTGNEVISMLKTTSLAYVIALTELFTAAQNIINRTYATIPLFIVACIWYLFMTSVLTIGQGFLERRFGRGSTRTPVSANPLQRLINVLRYSRPHVPDDHQGGGVAA